MESNFSISADVTVFGNQVSIAPDKEVPTRIESTDGFTIDKDHITKFKDNFPFPVGLKFPTGPKGALPTAIQISKIVVDTKNKELQLGLDVNFDKDFFLNKFPDVLTIDSLHAFISCKKTAPPAKKPTAGSR